MTTFSQQLDTLNNLWKGLEVWNATSIPITLATSLTNDYPHEINLADTIGHSKKNVLVSEVEQMRMFTGYQVNTTKILCNTVSLYSILWSINGAK